MRTIYTALALCAIGALAASAHAQSVADRVARVSDGTVRMTYAARPGICGRGTTIYHGPSSTTTWGSYSQREVEWDNDCEHGPIRLALDIRDHEVAALRFYIGGRWRPGGNDVTDLGTVPAKAAADFLLGLAEHGLGKVSREAIFPATLADDAVVWPALMRIARSEERPRETRRQAVFWLGQMAGDVATAHLDSLVYSNDIDRDVREQAIFALSQRPHDEGIPALIRVARTSRDAELRRKALFWLGQSNDPRALALFEEILTKR